MFPRKFHPNFRQVHFFTPEISPSGHLCSCEGFWQFHALCREISDIAAAIFCSNFMGSSVDCSLTPGRTSAGHPTELWSSGRQPFVRGGGTHRGSEAINIVPCASLVWYLVAQRMKPGKPLAEHKNVQKHWFRVWKNVPAEYNRASTSLDVRTLWNTIKYFYKSY